MVKQERRAYLDAIRARHSPEQIAGTLAAVHTDNPTLHASHETIYTSSCQTLLTLSYITLHFLHLVLETTQCFFRETWPALSLSEVCRFFIISPRIGRYKPGYCQNISSNMRLADFLSQYLFQSHL